LKNQEDTQSLEKRFRYNKKKQYTEWYNSLYSHADDIRLYIIQRL